MGIHSLSDKALFLTFTSDSYLSGTTKIVNLSLAVDGVLIFYAIAPLNLLYQTDHLFTSQGRVFSSSRN